MPSMCCTTTVSRRGQSEGFSNDIGTLQGLFSQLPVGLKHHRHSFFENSPGFLDSPLTLHATRTTPRHRAWSLYWDPSCLAQLRIFSATFLPRVTPA